MKKVRIVFLFCLLVSYNAFSQSAVTPQFKPIPFEQRLGPLVAYQQEYNRVMDSLESLEYEIMQIIGMNIDEELRREANAALQSVQHAMSTMQKDGNLGNAKDSYRRIRNYIQQAVANYNERVQQEQDRAARAAAEKARRQEEEQQQPKSWGGTGFALNRDYVVTNYHVIENAKTILVKGVNGEFSNSYKASVLSFDRGNDIAILRIIDDRFSGFSSVPYAVRTTTAEVGEDVFVLGYPLTATMGDEIKYTTGVISSKTGFQGDVSMYQMSAPIQPGNSGGPLFDRKGNLIGIVSAKHRGAENVGYAIKIFYLRNLIESNLSTDIIPMTNRLSTLPRTDMIKAIQKNVVQIECSIDGDFPVSKNAGNATNNTSPEPQPYASKRIEDGIKTILRPSYMGYLDSSIKILRVDLAKSYTKVYMKYTSPASNAWCSINKDTFIQEDVGGEHFTLVECTGIPLSPNKKTFDYKGEYVYFVLEFPPLPNALSTKKFDLVEPFSPWKFYNIIVD